ncbi:family 78 glycoside hydrolase catalytic domain [Wenyingzhuangia sp. IMCC45467]
MDKFFILIFTITFIQIKAATPGSPADLKCFDKFNPIGTGDKPYFSWIFNDPDDNEIQSAYQIIISTNPNINNTGEVWDSGMIVSRKQNYVYYDGAQLDAAKQYYWRVRTWDKDGNVGSYSNTSSFSTGLLTNNDWVNAKWIKRNTSVEDDYTYYRKTTTLPNKTIKKAITYLSASHSYELYVNGKLAGKGYNHHYPQYTYYQAWDITSLVKNNTDNVIACLTHWYEGGQGRSTSSRGLLLKTIIEYSDSSTTVIGSDSSWKQTQAKQWITGQPQRNGEGVGFIEKIDSREVIQDWNMIDYNDANWSSAIEIGSHPTSLWTNTLRPDLTRVIEEEINPISVNNIGNGEYVIDLGKVYSGSFKINFTGGTSGSIINMYGGFVLNSNNGSVSTSKNQNTNLNFIFVHNGESSVFYPNVYLGIRYLQVKNAPNTLDLTNVSFISRHYELDKTRSSFESSNTMLNSVWNLMIHSLIVGCQEGFVDTPTREKGPFLGDSWSQGVPSMSVMHDRIMNLRVLNEFIDSQDQYWSDGRLNAVYPNVDGGRDIPDYTQSFLVWVWDYYMQTGHLEFLKENYLKLKKIANYVDNHIDSNTGLVHNLSGGNGDYRYGIIDWPKSMRYGYDMSVSSRTVIDAYAYIDFEIMSKIAEVLDNESDSTLYKIKANNIKNAINTHLINSDGVYTDGLSTPTSISSHVSQHANIMPMALNIVPQEFFNSVTTEIKKQKMSVGMVSLRWLPEALGKANEGEHLIDLYTNTTWDGWAKNITQGATVTWESWNAYDNNESMSHPWGAVGLLGIQNYILGIKPLSPQHDLIEIKPLCFGNKLTYAKGIYPTDKGDIYVEWNSNENDFTLKVNIPDNMIAKIYLPKCNNEFLLIGDVGSGNYVFSLKDQLSNKNVNREKKIKFFPNPTSKEIFLNNTFNGSIEIYNTSGKLLNKINGINISNIDLSGFTKGVYILKFINKIKIETHKIILK